MGNVGPLQLLIIVLIAMVIFGASRVSELGKGLGEGIKNFKKGLRDDDEPRRITEGTSPKETKSQGSSDQTPDE